VRWPPVGRVLRPLRAATVHEEFDGQVDTKPKDLDQFIICVRTRDNVGIAGIGKARAGVVFKLSNDLAFAATDDVGDSFREVYPTRNGEQMILAFCVCDLHQGACPQAAGVGQDAAGHRDFIIPCKVLDDFKWSVVNRRQAPAEFGPGPAFNAGDQKTQHAVKDFDLILAEPFPVMQEKVGDLSKGRNPLLRRAAPDGVFEFGDDRMIQLLQDMPQVSLSTCPRRLARFRESRESGGNSTGTMAVAALRSR
jgi:hypothetical protein